MNAVRTALGLSAMVLVTGISACGHGKSGNASDPADLPTVVASTDVWGSVAKSVVGDYAKVTSIVNSASADPHSFEASPADAAAVIDASLVVYNGGGYDQWVDDILSSHPDLVSVEAYSFLDDAEVDDSAPANEHVFYDLDTAVGVAVGIADKLAKVDPGHGAEYTTNALAFGREATAIQQIEKSIRDTNPGAAVVATEPVAHYMLTAAGLTDKTPPGFASAIEQDTDPAPVDMAAMLDLINSRQVSALLINQQTVTEVTKQIQAVAEQADIPIVNITETLPAGDDYLTWQRDTASRLAAALNRN